MGRKSDRKHSKKNHSSPKGNDDSASLARKLLQFLNANFGKEFNAKQLIKQLEIRDSFNKDGVEPVLFQLVADGKISRSPRNYFSSTQDPEYISGKVDFVNPRFAFIIPDDPNAVEGGDILVKEADLKQALDGDKVRVMVFPVKGKTGRMEGRVLEIVERNRDEFVGRVEISPRFAFVVPDFKKMHKDIFVHRGELMGAEHNEKVIVKLTEWRDDDKNPTGKVIRVLGKAGLHEVEIHSIMAEFGLPFEYDKEADAEEKFKEIKYFSHVLHMVSTVSGIIKKDASRLEMLGQSYPAGTLTGAPKVKAMELIDKYETVNRSFYGGAIGQINFFGDVNHAIIIRSALSKNNTLF